MYGRWAVGSDGRAWLQYWFFYFYNDYNLVGDLFPAGLHEGDWEMIRLRLDPTGDGPDLAVCAQHEHAGARRWDDVEVRADRGVVYVARGSHAFYFAPGHPWTGHWFDQADGEGPAPDLALHITNDDPVYDWVLWPGPWGDTQPSGLPFDSTSPTSPSRPAREDWRYDASVSVAAQAALASTSAPASLPPG